MLNINFAGKLQINTKLNGGGGEAITGTSNTIEVLSVKASYFPQKLN
jgi:hypothetical protein